MGVMIDEEIQGVAYAICTLISTLNNNLLLIFNVVLLVNSRIVLLELKV